MNSAPIEALPLPVRSGKTIVNGTDIAFYVRGAGFPLVLVTGYRLHGDAWPDEFVEALARRFTVITIDNRGTGKSDKPVHGYALQNLADDVVAVLGELGISRAHALGYSMGGAIVQELACHHPDRVGGLVLCATLCGGASTVRAPLSVLRILRDLDGRSPDVIGRRMWDVTYAPEYLLRHRDRAERQLQREILRPTPLHAADLQFQALTEFDTSAALSSLRTPTLVMTGDVDQIVLPHNSTILADLIPEAVLRVLPGCGHRLMWEKPLQCAAVVTEFLEACDAPAERNSPYGDRLRSDGGVALPYEIVDIRRDSLWWGMEHLIGWPAAVEDYVADFITKTIYTISFGGRLRFGDGKPVILVPPPLMGDFALAGVSAWLKSIGYRPSGIGLLSRLDDRMVERLVAVAIQDAVGRIGRKAVVIIFGGGIEAVSHAAKAEDVSDIIVLGYCGPRQPDFSRGVRLHFLEYGYSDDRSGGATEARRLAGWPLPAAMLQSTFITISDILYDIPIKLTPNAASMARAL